MSDRPGLLKRFDGTGVPLLVARLVLGFVFLWMGLSKTGIVYPALEKMGLSQTETVRYMVSKGKISEPLEFRKLINQYEVIPENQYVLLNVLAGVLPWFEVLCALFLIAGVALRGTGFIFFAMLTGFTIMIAWRAMGIYSAGDIGFCDIEFDCGCGAGVVNICHKLPENTILWLLSLMVLVSRSRRFCLLGDLFSKVPEPAVVQSE